MGLKSIFLCIHGVGSRILGAAEVACKIFRQSGDIIKSQTRIGFHYGNYSSLAPLILFDSPSAGRHCHLQSGCSIRMKAQPLDQIKGNKKRDRLLGRARYNKFRSFVFRQAQDERPFINFNSATSPATRSTVARSSPGRRAGRPPPAGPARTAGWPSP